MCHMLPQSPQQALLGTVNLPPLSTGIPCSLEQMLPESCLCPLFPSNCTESLPHLRFAAVLAL